jgi:multimeric flavodoxin WrbA
MKVLGICCSPRKGGNTENLVKEALRGSALEGAETICSVSPASTLNPVMAAGAAI